MNTSRTVHVARMRIPGLLLLATALCALSLPAQEQSSGQKPSKPEKSSTEQQSPPVVSVDSARKSSDLATSGTTENNLGLGAGVYEVKQSFEFGGRLSDFTGSRAMWDTFVNLGTGPRLLEYTLDLRAPKHDGLLFDNLSFSNYGYGGDPNNVTRLRVSKGKYYNLNASFRRDQNIFDYDLLANPLNPATSNPNVPIKDSPHEFLMTRRMGDVNVTLMPLSKIRFRLGYSRVTTQGTTFSSVHEGTEGLLFQPTSNITDNYQFGVSLRFIPRTSINYDQFYTYYKGDTSAALSSFGLPSFTLAGGIPVSLGIPFNTVAGQPCATPVLGSGFANPACNGYFSYNRSGPTRTSFPTEQFSVQSNYFRRVDFSARINYSQAENVMPNYGETFSGLITRTRQRVFAIAGGSSTHRVSLAGDFGISWRVTDKLRIVDTFRYDNFRLPGGFAYTTASLFGATLLSNPNLFTPATCPPPFTAATCPQHNASSSADIINDTLSDFLRQEEKVNTIELEYDFTRRFNAHVGYRYVSRDITNNHTDIQVQTFFPGPTAALANRGACAPAATHPLNPDGTCTTTVTTPDASFTPITGHALVFGFSARPIDHLRIIFDTDILYNDNAFTRISPRQMQQYRLRTTYQPLNWVSFGGAVTIFENRNNTADIGNLQHNRSYAFNTTVAPAEGKWGFDLSYDYNDIFSQTNICYVATPTPPGALTCGAPFLSGLSFYTNTSNFASGSFFLKPISRVTVAAGYAVTSTTGSTLILDQLSPTGPLSYNYHLPTASLAIQLTKHLLYKTGWNYYDYNEKSAPGPTLPRDFRGNTFTLSMRYTM